MYTITTEDVRALRRATDLCFDHNGDVQNSSESRIRAIRRFHGHQQHQPEQTYIVNVEGQRVHNYGSDSPAAFDCFHMAMSAQHDDHVRTLVHLINKGDRLGFVWTRDNSSPITREAGIVVDMLDVQIVKPGARGTYTVRLHTSVSLDNSARMVRARRVVEVPINDAEPGLCRHEACGYGDCSWLQEGGMRDGNPVCNHHLNHKCKRATGHGHTA